MIRLRTVMAAGGVAALVAVAAACDTATTAGHNWVITPDVELHRTAIFNGTGKPLIRATGQCSDGTRTWIAKSVERNVNTMTQGQTLIVNCGTGYPVGTWGMEERAS